MLRPQYFHNIFQQILGDKLWLVRIWTRYLNYFIVYE